MPPWIGKYLETKDPTVGVLLLLLIGLYFWSERRWKDRAGGLRADRKTMMDLVAQCTAAHVTGSQAILSLSNAVDRLSSAFTAMEAQRTQDTIESERRRATDLIEIIRAVRERPNGWDSKRGG